MDRVPTGQVNMAYTVMADMAMSNIPTAHTAMASGPAFFRRFPTACIFMAYTVMAYAVMA